MTPSPRRSPFRVDARYRPTSSFTDGVATFRMGEVVTFVGESRRDGAEAASYVFRDAAGALRTFEVPDDMPDLALHVRFRAVEARDGGCPECRAQRVRGLRPPLEQVGHGDGPVLYYQCRRCMALWEETTREAHIVWDRLLTCPHLQALERDLRTSGVRVELERKDWNEKGTGFWVFFRSGIDRDATRARFTLPDFVEWHEWDGRVGGHEAGFHCTQCRSGVMGVHPNYADGYPCFPSKMDVPPRFEPRTRPSSSSSSASRASRARPRTLLQDLAPLLAFLFLFFGAIAAAWWAGKR